MLPTLTVVFAALAAKPAWRRGRFVALVALIPVGRAVVLYVCRGLFLAAHLMLVASGLALAARLLRG